MVGLCGEALRLPLVGAGQVTRDVVGGVLAGFGARVVV